MITSSIQLAARLTDLLYRDGIVNADSAQALFDVLADALERRPDVVTAVSEDMELVQQERDEYIANVMKKLDEIEQQALRDYHAGDAKDATASVTGGHNED